MHKVHKLLFFMLFCHISYGHNIALLIVATGRYIQFVEPLIQSARKHFCVGHTVHYFVFTDALVNLGQDVTILHQEHSKWPFSTMNRFHTYYRYQSKLQEMDYLFACDADMQFVGTVGDELLGDLVGMQHPLFVGKRGPYEINSHSRACVRNKEGTLYYGGGFYGGKRDEVIKLWEQCIHDVDADLRDNVIAMVHDESHLNRYFIDHQPTVTLFVPYTCYAWTFVQGSSRILVLSKDDKAYHV